MASDLAVAFAHSGVQKLDDTCGIGAKRLGHGEGYKYAHDFDGHWVEQDYLGVDREYYRPTDEGFEARIKERLDRLRKLRKERRPPENDASPGR